MVFLYGMNYWSAMCQWVFYLTLQPCQIWHWYNQDGTNHWSCPKLIPNKISVAPHYIQVFILFLLPKHLLKYLLCCRSGLDQRGSWQFVLHLMMEDPVYQRLNISIMKITYIRYCYIFKVWVELLSPHQPSSIYAFTVYISAHTQILYICIDTHIHMYMHTNFILKW